jgi:hypothetical protein
MTPSSSNPGSSSLEQRAPVVDLARYHYGRSGMGEVRGAIEVAPAGRASDGDRNARTRMFPLRHIMCLQWQPVFGDAWPCLRALLEALGGRGVAVAAVDMWSIERPSGFAVEERPGRVQALTIGRHEACSLSLGGDPSVALRHATLLAHSAPDDAEKLQLTLVDLRTASGFRDEAGASVQSLRANGPLFAMIGRYAIFFLMSPPRFVRPRRTAGVKPLCASAVPPPPTRCTRPRSRGQPRAFAE